MKGHSMNKNMIKLRINPEENIKNYPLDGIIKKGARKMLQKALEIEIPVVTQGQVKKLL